MNWKNVLILAIVVTTLLECGADFIDDTCSHTPYPDTCKSVIRSDPRSGNGSTTELGVIVVEKLKDNENNDIGKINDLIRSVKEPKVKAALMVCSDNYTTLGSLIQSAWQAFTYGNPKFAEEAMINSRKIIEVCESGFDGKSPIKAENTICKELSAVGAAIARLLL